MLVKRGSRISARYPILMFFNRINIILIFSNPVWLLLFRLPHYGLARYHRMMTSSNGNIFRVTGPLCGEFTGPGEFPTQRPVTRSFDVFFDLRLNKRLSKQPWGWWFETPSWSLWCQCNGTCPFVWSLIDRPQANNHKINICRTVFDFLPCAHYTNINN